MFRCRNTNVLGRTSLKMKYLPKSRNSQIWSSLAKSEPENRLLWDAFWRPLATRQHDHTNHQIDPKKKPIKMSIASFNRQFYA